MIKSVMVRMRRTVGGVAQTTIAVHLEPDSQVCKSIAELAFALPISKLTGGVISDEINDLSTRVISRLFLLHPRPGQKGGDDSCYSASVRSLP